MQECLAAIHNWWYLDSGYSRHMTGDKTKFCLLTKGEGGQVTFGENSKGKIIGSSKVGKNLSSCIDDVMLIERLVYNLLSISQLCDKGHKVLFDFETQTYLVSFRFFIVSKIVNKLFGIHACFAQIDLLI